MAIVGMAFPGMAMSIFSMIFLTINIRESMIFLAIFAMSCPLFGLLLARFHWPKNSLLATVDEVTFQESSMQAEDLESKEAA